MAIFRTTISHAELTWQGLQLIRQKKMGNKMIFATVGDCMFIISFFVLGGEFWDKIRALFVYTAA